MLRRFYAGGTPAEENDKTGAVTHPTIGTLFPSESLMPTHQKCVVRTAQENANKSLISLFWCN